MTLGSTRAVLALLFATSVTIQAQASPAEHPALFLIGDSIVRTGSGNGDTGPWGWGSELAALFDPLKIHVYYFNDSQHSTRQGAKLNAESVATGLRSLKNCPLADDLIRH